MKVAVNIRGARWHARSERHWHYTACGRLFADKTHQMINDPTRINCRKCLKEHDIAPQPQDS